MFNISTEYPCIVTTTHRIPTLLSQIISLHLHKWKLWLSTERLVSVKLLYVLCIFTECSREEIQRELRKLSLLTGVVVIIPASHTITGRTPVEVLPDRSPHTQFNISLFHFVYQIF